jgi:DNA-binding IclR family transcriptional regulator
MAEQTGYHVGHVRRLLKALVAEGVLIQHSSRGRHPTIYDVATRAFGQGKLFTTRAPVRANPRMDARSTRASDARLTVVNGEERTTAVVDDPEGSPPAWDPETFPAGIAEARKAMGRAL